MTASTSNSQPGRAAPVPRSALVLCSLSALLTGCETLQLSSFLPPPPSEWAKRLDGSRLTGARAGIGDVIGPLQRTALAQSRDTNSEAARAILQDAQRLYEDSEYAGAEIAFKKVSDSRDPRKFKLFARTKSDEKRLEYDPIREEAVFYLAESQYMQSKYPKADETYKALIKDYPSSRYLDESSRRLFEIAKVWLGVDDFVTSDEIRMVSLEEGNRSIPLSSQTPPKRRYLPNFTDKSRPTFDAPGQALNSLRAIWINDPSGPLADDAIMLAATHNLRRQNYREASRLMKLIREQFPKSPHLQNAFVIGSHVELMSYQGPKYDEQRLEEALELKENALRLFPDAPEADRMRRDLKTLRDARAEREWELALFYEKKNKPKAVAIYCRELLRQFPDSKFASLARQKLAELDGEDFTFDATPQEPDAPIQPFQSVPEVPSGPVFESGGPIYDNGPQG